MGEGRRVKSTIGVLIVDDSAVYREFLAHILGSDPSITVAGSVRDGAAALAAVASLRPDVITMDVNMPGMNGYDVTRKIMETFPTPIIVVSSASDVGDVESSFRAMESGAVAVISKVRGGDSPGARAHSRELVQMVKLMAEVKVIKRWARKPVPTFESSGARADRALTGDVGAILIGASTGSPVPIRTILSALPAGFPSAVLIVQHIAAGFVRGSRTGCPKPLGFPFTSLPKGSP